MRINYEYSILVGVILVIITGLLKIFIVNDVIYESG